ncbi:MAG: YkgJ family cysteine cluster protein [Desulfobacteraceae bacterium]|jgi:Fe-S-cluster containining protein|nr:YkgJ family cysteine cluster protein [Desulfobacteraceae bacterium]
MNIDYRPFFKEYEELRDKADAAFNKVQKEYQGQVTCGLGCDDCCYALFDLSLIEAIYINTQFNKSFQGKKKADLVEAAGRIDRRIYKLKKKAYKDLENGKNEIEILGAISMERIKCPLLNDKKQCEMYENRPITCRIYGMPTSTAGSSHICGQTNFVEGEKYPTINMDIIHDQLYKISAMFAGSIKTKYTKLTDMLIPLSMALITDFNEEYLGISIEKGEK